MGAVRNEVLHGDVLEQLKKLPDSCIQTVVTSPPYFGLRDYGTRRWFGGDPACEHDQGVEHGPHHPGQVEQTKWKTAEAAGKGQSALTHSCSKCHAWYGQLGLEPTPDLYVEHMVEVFREVRRTLRPDGTVWLNLGDSYANDGKWGGSTSGKHVKDLHGNTSVGRTKKTTGFKPKDLMMVPARVAIALQDDGWFLRCDIIWAKGNPMPESVRDRPTRAHEYVFLLTKNQDYFYDSDAIREPAGDWVDDDPRYQEGVERQGRDLEEPSRHAFPGPPVTGLDRRPITNRNKRSVWTINQKPYRGAHFATMPEELAKHCILAGSSEKGSCPTCGAPWERVIERGESHYAELKGDRHWTDLQDDALERGKMTRGGPTVTENGTVPSLYAAPRVELGWRATCKCLESDKPVPCLVLDPFAGSGTTLAVAKMHGRDYVGVELNEKYLPLIADRVRKPTEWQEQRAIFDFMMTLD